MLSHMSRHMQCYNYTVIRNVMHLQDADAFGSLVNDHIASTREPVLLLAYASEFYLHVDTVSSVIDACIGVYIIDSRR